MNDVDAALSLPLWVHPYRTAELPDYPSESSSRLGMWMAFGWPYDTTALGAVMPSPPVGAR